MRRIIACELGPELANKLRRFTIAAQTYKTRIIRMALEEFLTKHLSENKEMRERYEKIAREEDESERRQLAGAKPRDHLKVIK